MPSESVDAKRIGQLSEEKALIRILSDYEQAKANKLDDIERCKRYLHIFKALDPPDEIISPDETSGKVEEDEAIYANTYMPVGAAIVEAGIAQLYNLIFSTPYYMEIGANDLEDSFYAERVTAHQFKRHKEMRFRSKVYQALQQAAVYDYCVTGTRWLLEDGYVPQRQTKETMLNLGGMKIPYREVSAKPKYLPDKTDRSDFFVLRYDKCYHDWTSVDGLDDSRFFIDEREEMVESLLANSKVQKPWGRYEHVDEVVARYLKNIADSGTKYEKAMLQPDVDPLVQREFINTRRIKIIRYWTKQHLIEVAQERIIRRMHVYDWPLQLWKIFRIPNTFRGMGLLERLERNQLDINASLNSRRNFQNLVSQPFAVIDRELLGAHEGEPEIYPGWLGTFKGGSARDKIWVYTPGTNTSQDVIGDIRSETAMMERMSGVSQAMQGAISPGRTTATEISEVATGTGTRADTLSDLIESECLEPTYLSLFFLEAVFLNRRESFLYHGRHGDQMYLIDSSTYKWNTLPRFEAKGTHDAIHNIIETNQFLAALDRALAMPMVTHNWDNIALQMWKRLVPHEYHKFVNDPNIPQENIPADMENVILALGRDVKISPLNDHNQHIQAHNALKNTPDYQLWDDSRKMRLEQHIQEHQAGASSGGNGSGRPQMANAPADLMRGNRPTTTPNMQGIVGA